MSQLILFLLVVVVEVDGKSFWAIKKALNKRPGQVVELLWLQSLSSRLPPGARSYLLAANYFG